jgi:hypothetical protein
MREYFRPYTKAVTISDADAHIIELKDTSGNFISSNYITVESVSGEGTSFFLAAPSGINVAAAADAFVASSMVGVASGINGLASNNLGGSVVLGLGDFDKVTSIVLSQAVAEAVTYLVSYGNVSLANQIADAKAPRGN